MEDVWFHGEKVGERRRLDSRLLLAHLARLDKLEEKPDAAMLADSFDDVIEALRESRELPAEPAPEPTEDPASERCNTRSMPCCRDPRSASCAGCPERHRRLLEEMDDTRPEDAPEPEALGELEAVDARQMEAFLGGDEEWWRYDAEGALRYTDTLTGELLPLATPGAREATVVTAEVDAPPASIDDGAPISDEAPPAPPAPPAPFVDAAAPDQTAAYAPNPSADCAASTKNVASVSTSSAATSFEERTKAQAMNATPLVSEAQSPSSSSHSSPAGADGMFHSTPATPSAIDCSADRPTSPRITTFL